MMAAVSELTSFYVTAGRGTESFVASEVKEKLKPDHICIRDGKMFFKFSSVSGLNMHKILALKSVERLFIEVTDYDNSTYIQTKRTFLDKLMLTLSASENFFSARMVLAQLILLKQKDHCTENGNILYHLRNPNAYVPKPVSTEHHLTKSCSFLKIKDLQKPLRNNCVSISTTKASDSDQALEAVLDKEPPIKHRKLDIPCSISHTMEEHTPELNYDKPVADFFPDNSRHINIDCQKQDMPEKSTYHDCILNCCTTAMSNEQQQACHLKHKSESDRESGDNGCLSFRMSIKCSGKVSKWINLKKLSRDLGWRVARATGWRVDLRHPQYEVCLHISNDNVTAGIPMTRFPLSKRMYIVDSGLRAPVAWIMSQLCSIKPGDIVLDPMCGKATILLEASSDFREAWFLGNDNDISQIDKALQNLHTCGHSNTVSLLKADGLNMTYRDGCLDVVVCDAPFNQKHLFDVAPKVFYHKFLREIYRILRPQGRCVLLISEQLSHIVLSVIQTTAEGQKQHLNIKSEMSSSLMECKDNGMHDESHETTDDTVPLIFTSSHYMKLGETHACVIVLHK